MKTHATLRVKKYHLSTIYYKYKCILAMKRKEDATFFLACNAGGEFWLPVFTHF